MADDYKNPAADSVSQFSTLFGTGGNDIRVCKESVLQSLLERVFILR